MNIIFCRINRDRKVVRVELLEVNRRTFWVKMNNGKIIKRKIERDMVIK